MDEKDERQVHRGSDGKARVRKVRKDGWTAKRKRILLQMLAATGNIELSVAAAGKSRKSFSDLRWRDPEFADLCRTALEMGYERLEAMLMERAGGTVTIDLSKVDMSALDEDEIAVPDVSTMDTELALKLLSMRGRTLQDKGTRPRRRPRRLATPEETDAAILKQLSVLNRRLGGQG